MIILISKVLVTFELSTFHYAALLNGSLFISDFNPLVWRNLSANCPKSSGLLFFYLKQRSGNAFHFVFHFK